MSYDPREGSRIRFDRYSRAGLRQRIDIDMAKRRRGRDSGEAGVRQRSLWELYRQLCLVLRGNWPSLIGGLVLGTSATLLKLTPPAATKIAVDNVVLGRPLPGWLPSWLPIPAGAEARLYALALAVFAVAVTGVVLSIAGRWLVTRVSKRVQSRLQKQVFEHAAHLPLNRIYALRAGGAASVLRVDAGGVGYLVFSMLFNPWRAVVQFLGGLIVLAWIDWRLLLFALLLVPAVVVSRWIWNHRLRPLHREVHSQREEIDARATEVFGGMRVVRSFGRQLREAARYVRGNHFLIRLEMLEWRWARYVESFWDLVLPGATGALLVYGGIRVVNGVLTPGDLVMFMIFMAMLLEPVALIANSLTAMQAQLAGFDRVLDILAEPREMPPAPGAVHLRREEVRGRLTLNDVSFRYPGCEADVLHGITLEVLAGETIALVGPSGSGKTTLCNLVARFYDPTAGSVSLDGRDLRSIDVESYRRMLGIVEQDVFLFDGTVEENIAYARRQASREEVEAAARAANAADFIRDFPEGYDTLVGERGVRISGGQRQRLAIARAILAHARILILDEATSNLDSESERMIQQSLEGLLRDRTSFVIAHRLSTVRHADRIVVMEGGRIAEVGSHDELLALGGRYAEMVALQNVGI